MSAEKRCSDRFGTVTMSISASFKRLMAPASDSAAV